MAYRFVRAFHLGRVVPVIDEALALEIKEKNINLKKLNTRRNMGLTRMPAILELAAEARIRKIANPKFRKEVKELLFVISRMKQPDDQDSIKLKEGDIKTELEVRDKLRNRPDYDPEKFTLHEDQFMANIELKDLIQGTLLQRRRDWHYYEYDEYASILYMATRLPSNYACLRTVMREICDLVPTFKPRSVLDFGSGMGTTIWAVNETWPESVQEFMNIDLSKDQQHLCDFLLRGGKDLGPNPPNIYHRQYLPVSNKVEYDLVVAAFSLLEVPNAQSRIQIIENLWHKTNDFLVIIERGNKGGFTLINEARHFILDTTGHQVTKKIVFSTQTSPKINQKLPSSHILAPCSHEFACPRPMMPSKNQIDTCRFEVAYEPLDIGQSKPGFLREQFSYVVFRKQPHPIYFEEVSRWPRVVERRKKPQKQVIHKVCCPNGCLAEIVFTKKRYGNETYELAKSCDWGDLIPIKIRDTYESRSSKKGNFSDRSDIKDEVDNSNK